MRIVFLTVPAALLAGCAAGQADVPAGPRDPQAQVRAVEYRSAFEGYRAFAGPEIVDWRKANEEVGAGGGHAGHRPGQGPGQPSSKPQPGESNK